MKVISDCSLISIPYHPRHNWNQRYASPSGISPSLVLDFASGIHGKDGIRENGIAQFGRPSTASYFAANGKLKNAATDTVRKCYDPKGKDAKGIWIEEQSTNILIDSENLSLPSWVSVATDVLENQFPDPTGSVLMDKVAETSAASSFHLIRQQVSGDVGQSWSFSFFVRPAGRDKFRLRLRGFNASSEWIDANINLSNQTTTIIPTAGAGTDGVCRLEQVDTGNDIWRVSVSGTPISGGGAGVIRATIYLRNDAGALFYDGDGVSGLGVWGAQLENKSRPSSYIATTSAPVTRSSEAVNILTGPWFDPTKGTILAEFTAHGPLEDEWVWSFNDGTSGNLIGLKLSGGDSVGADLVQSGGANQLASLSFAASEQSPITSVLAYSENDFALSVNGAAANTSMSGILPGGISRLDIGRLVNANQSLKGTLSRLFYYPERLSNADIQTLSTR